MHVGQKIVLKADMLIKYKYSCIHWDKKKKEKYPKPSEEAVCLAYGSPEEYIIVIMEDEYVLFDREYNAPMYSTAFIMYKKDLMEVLGINEGVYDIY